MNTTKNRARKKIPALAAMALMTALTGSILPASASAAAPSANEAAKSGRETQKTNSASQTRRASAPAAETAASAAGAAAAAAETPSAERPGSLNAALSASSAELPGSSAALPAPSAGFSAAAAPAAASPRIPESLPAIPATKIAPAAPTAAFNKLAAARDVKGMWALIDAQAPSVSQATLTVWLRSLEAVQNKRLFSLEEELAAEKVQDALMQANLYESAAWTEGARTGVAQADKLLDEITGQGYVLDTTEGYYFPKIDYERYMKYAKRVIPRYAQYLSLRADDTRSEMTKDAGLIISWQEMLDRADRQSLYLQRYPNTPETKAIQEMYRQSLYIALYGTDNVQLFDYDTNVMDYQARKAYQRYLALKSQTPFAQTMRGYMKILEKSGFKLSKAAEAYRDARNPWLAE